MAHPSYLKSAVEDASKSPIQRYPGYSVKYSSAVGGHFGTSDRSVELASSSRGGGGGGALKHSAVQSEQQSSYT